MRIHDHRYHGLDLLRSLARRCLALDSPVLAPRFGAFGPRGDACADEKQHRPCAVAGRAVLSGLYAAAIASNGNQRDA